MEDENQPCLFYEFDVFNDSPPLSSNINRNATQEEIRELCTSIGGFEQWSDLPTEIQQKIVEKLDFITRKSFSKCSRACQQIVNNTQFPIYEIRCEDDYTYEGDEKKNYTNVRIIFTKDERVQIDAKFSSNGNEIKIIFLYHDLNRKMRIKIEKNISQNYQIFIQRIIEDFQIKSRQSLQRFTFTSELQNLTNYEFKSFKCLKRLRVSYNSINDVLRWFDICQSIPSLQQLQLVCNDYSDEPYTLPSTIFDHRLIKDTDDFYIWGNCEINDKQFLEINSSHFVLTSDTITADAVNKFIKRWTAMEQPKYNDFKCFTIWTTRHFNESAIIRGLNVRLWDDEFERETMGFSGDFRRVCGNGQLYQLPNKCNTLSATIQITEDRVSFQVTGRWYYHNGKKYFSYSIPI